MRHSDHSVSSYIRGIARPQIDFRFGWKSGYATHITPMTESVKVFGCRPLTDVPRARVAGVGKPPKEETAGREGGRFVTRYGDLSAANGARD